MAEQSDGDDGEFHFEGDALTLDLVNTEDMARGRRRDLLAAPGAVTRWWRAAEAHRPDRAVVHADGMDRLDNDTLRDALVALRSAVRGIMAAMASGVVPPADDVACLNATLATGPHMLEFTPDGDPRLVHRSADPCGPVLLPIALSAARLATDSARNRVRACDNERCILLFYDTTKSATRRWCSVGCKDRDRKMKRYHEVRAAHPSVEPLPAIDANGHPRRPRPEEPRSR